MGKFSPQTRSAYAGHMAEAVRWFGRHFDRGKIFTALDRWRIVWEGSSEDDEKGAKNAKIILWSRVEKLLEAYPI